MRKSMKKSIILAMVALLTITFSIPVCATESKTNTTTSNINSPEAAPSTTSGSLLLDDKAGLLKGSEPQQLLETLDMASSNSDCNIVVLTTNQGLSESAIQSYADSYYRTNVQGKSPSTFCITLTVDISSRKVDVGTYNPGSKRNLNDKAKDELREYVTSDLTDGYYYKAFTKYADKASDMAVSINEDGSRNKAAFPWVKKIIISLVIGVILAVLICIIIKSQLKSVAMKTDATDYVREGSLNITSQSDRFLYSNVTKTAKPKNNSSSGGYGGGSSGSHSTGSF